MVDFLRHHMRLQGARRLSLALSILATIAAWSATSASASTYGVIAWGENGSGELGDGNLLSSEVPVTVLGLHGVASVSDGGDHGLALMDDGTVMAWGANHAGQLGDGTTTNSSVPVPVSGLSDVVAISAGGSHSLALLSDGTVMAWGSNYRGQLGDGNTESSDVPVPVSGLKGVSAISAGGEHNLALLSSGEVAAWGANYAGQLGYSSRPGDTGFCEGCISDVPVMVGGLSDVASVAAGGAHSLAMLTDGRVLGWGANDYGQVGSGRQCEGCATNIPAEVTGELSGVKELSAGGNQSLALLDDGEVMEWGGLKGDTPVEVAGLTGVSAISAGDSHSMALRSDGTIMGWTFTVTAVNGPQEAVGISAGGDSLAYGPPLPTVAHVTPNLGAASGGTSVTITGPDGTDFSGATAVRFGSASPSSFTVDSPTSITATAPAGTGVVDVTVTSPAGTSPPTAADKFEYLQAGAPEFGRCEKLAGTKVGKVTEYDGSYTSAKCTTLSASKNGKYEWLPGPGPHSHFTGDSSSITIETSNRYVRNALFCHSEADAGEITGPRSTSLTVTLAGCEDAVSKVPCESEGAASGEIRSYPLEAVLGVIAAGAKPSIGLDLKPAGLNAPDLAEFECGGGGLARIDGSAIGEVKALNKMTSALTISYKELSKSKGKGLQLPESFESGPKDTLAMGIAKLEQSALMASDSLATEEALEIRTVG